jgi:glycosyltransferase involved in cell wall biosynthesis
VVHTHSAKAGALGRVAAAIVGVPAVHTVHGWGPLYSEHRGVRRVALSTERTLARITDALVVVGQADLDRGVDLGIGDRQHYRLIRSGVDVEVSARASATRPAVRHELRTAVLTASGGAIDIADRALVGMVSRLAAPKDHDTLLAAFARTDPGLHDPAGQGLVLVLIGDGPRRREIEAAVARAGLGRRVALLGSRPDAARLVAGFDVSVLSSRWEGMPRVVVEAAAASTPVVTTAVGSVGDLIEDGASGRVVPVGDAGAMAAATAMLIERPERAEAMAAEAARRSGAFSAERMRADLARLWSDVAGREADAGSDRRRYQEAKNRTGVGARTVGTR